MQTTQMEQKTEFKRLRALGIADIKQRLERETEKIKSKGLNASLSWFHKTYKGNEATQQRKLMRFLQGKEKNAISKFENSLKAVEEAPDLLGNLVITLEWSRGSMQAMQAKPYTNYGFEGSKTGGWGYDKASSATAKAMNNHLPLLKLLYAKKEKLLATWKGKNNKNAFNREILGYGSGYNILPRFEGGVGVNSHIRIIEGLGLIWQNVSNTERTDVYLISKKTQ